ncbi:HVA22-like protein a [Panicum virgatum]|uniref:HVA22-like protein n=1 Tax=Panicum virgatum TaxID=38727 RepID=A0A8T0X9M3_PANVG|nr:HVA22-like protein a [Panicum virgatum]KAG2654023.1 hypothetical protein PVAP13_1NG539600 [Panicum virgatum]
MGGGGSGSFLKVLVNNLDVLAGPLVSLAYPLYASVRAIETKSAVDDQQWLTYWVLYSFITLFELTFAPVLEWLPFWSYAKLFFNCWLVLPQFNGAAHVYEHFVRPMIVNQQVVNIWYIPKKGEPERPDDVISAAQRYIEQNGSQAFENLVNKFKSSNPRRSILEEVEVERRARIQRESEAREANPFFNPDYRY